MKYHARPYRPLPLYRRVLYGLRLVAGAAALVFFGWALIVAALLVTP